MKHLFIWIAIILAFPSYAQQCDYAFLGEIKDFHDGTPIVGATVYIKSLDKYTTSDHNGKFKIQRLCKGELTLMISHIACETKTETFTLNGDLYKLIQLEHHIEELSEVDIKAELAKKETKTAQETIIKTEKIENFSSASLANATETISGVSTLSTGNNIVKPVINGFHSSRILIMNNGVRMEDQEWGIEHAPNIDVNSVNEISVVKGASALAYGGDAVGGAIVLKPSKIFKKDSLFGKTIASYNSNNRGYSINSSITKTTDKGWYINGQGTYKRFGDSEAPDYNLTNTGLDSKAFSVQTGYRSFKRSMNLYYNYVDNEIGILSSSHIGSIESLIEAINSNVPLVVNDFSYDINNPKQRVRHHLAKAEYIQRFSNLGKLTAQYDYQNNHREEFDRRRGGRDNIPAVDLRLQTHSLQAKFLFDKNSDRRYEAGLLYRYQDNFADPATGVRRLIPDYNRYDAGAFITSEWQLPNDLLLEAGLRYDYNHIDAQKFYQESRWIERGYNIDFADWVVEDLGTQLLTNPVYDFHNVSFSAGAKKEFGNHTVLLNYALSNRAPNPSELFSDGLHQSIARVELGDLRLDKETAHRFSGTYEYNTNNLNVLVEPFLNRISNYIFIVPTEQGITGTSNAGAFLEYEYKSTDALLYGVDFSFNMDLTLHINLTNNTAFLIGDDLDNNESLVDIPPFNTTTSINYTNKRWLNFKSSLTSEFIAMQNNYPDFNFIYTNPLDASETLVDVSTPPDAYHLMRFRSSISTNIFKKSELEIGLAIQNIFNTNYRNYLNRLRFFADETGRNIQLQIKINY